jgi:hypothetical protein
MRINQGTPEPRIRELKAWLLADTACALAHMGHRDAARSALTTARERWHAPDADDQADMEWVTALVEMYLGRDDVAEQLVSTSVRHWEGQRPPASDPGPHHPGSTPCPAGDSRGNEMAYRMIRDVRELRSVRARERLKPMIETLEARPESESLRLAGLARRVISV